MNRRPPRTGTVTAYDAERGLGTVRDDEGAELSFHCTALEDGSRQVGVGTRVAYVAVPGHRGRFEARGLVKLAEPAP